MNIADLEATNSTVVSASIVTPEVYRLCIEILHVPLFFFGIFGIFSNGFNIMVFAKQGVASDSTTVSLVALSVSDLLGCAFMLPQPVCFYLKSTSDSGAALEHNCFALTTMTCTYTHIICSKVTCFITAYISVERAVSVVFPLRVKRIIRMQSTVTVIIAIFIVAVALHAPYAASIEMVWGSTLDNSTVVTLRVTALGKLFNAINNILIAMVLTTASMVTVAIATVVMISRVHVSVKWRLGHARNGNSFSANVKASDKNVCTKMSGKMSSKNIEMCKTVMGIMTLFLVCSACSHIPAMAVLSLPGMSSYGVNRYLYEIFYTMKFDFDLINSSANMLFYIKISSRYRQTMVNMLGKFKSEPRTLNMK
ncbi:G-protein coupled receptor [Biomphalaria glabrata]|nr:G-protein coupled receptor [Biomphalaria glabrata]